MVPISSSHVHEVKTFYLRYSTTGECVIVIYATINFGNMYLQTEEEKMRRSRVGGSKKKNSLSMSAGEYDFLSLSIFWLIIIFNENSLPN